MSLNDWSPQALLNSPEKRELVEAIRNKELENLNERKRAEKGYVKLIACKIDYNLSDKWHTMSLCADCISQYEPPVRVKRVGDTGAYQCEGCQKYNQQFQKN